MNKLPAATAPRLHSPPSANQIADHEPAQTLTRLQPSISCQTCDSSALTCLLAVIGHLCIWAVPWVEFWEDTTSTNCRKEVQKTPDQCHTLKNNKNVCCSVIACGSVWKCVKVCYSEYTEECLSVVYIPLLSSSLSLCINQTCQCKWLCQPGSACVPQRALQCVQRVLQTVLKCVLQGTLQRALECAALCNSVL